MSLQKQKPYRSKEYLDYVRSLPCSVVRCYDQAEAHHTEGGNGIAMKGSDLSCIPLCRVHHVICHSMGRISFYETHCLDRWELVAETLKGWIEREG